MITATLIGGGTPQMVQIVIDATPAGVPWTLTGSVDDQTWPVPGGVGVGDGGQLVLTDNRAPGNRPIVYTFAAGAARQASEPIVVPFSTDFVLQSLTGSRSLALELYSGSLNTELSSNHAQFRIPGRSRPSIRYDVGGDIEGNFGVIVERDQAQTFREMILEGGPLLYRLGAELADIDPVGVIAYGDLSSELLPRHGKRVWRLPYTLIDDPYLDVRLGAFSWDDVDAALAGMTWTEFDTRFAALTWDQVDTFDWATI
ncbi:hypothetical protein M4D51_08045 [Microbacterium sp. p3-SID338]|uniref:hypothetical protein n=1 Tax=Microbacterium sp. p3-SID338 TaxID=2916214 RepID=UPI0021A68AAA|nr:hypothetical protein [Microbacterium sp. p3-SID338]MCT1395676.1 hypothetical protein [Microbacterium sp. p3-SID338]